MSNQSIEILNTAIKYFQEKKFFEAKKVITQLIINEEKNLDALNIMGAILFSENNYYDAIVYFDKIIQLNPNYADAWYNKAITLHDLKRFEEAINNYDKTIKLNPDYFKAWSNKGIVLHDLKRYEEALYNYDKAIELNPNYSEPWSNKGITLNNLKRYEEAIYCHNKAISLNLNFSKAWNNKSATLLNMNRYNEALNSCDKAIQLDPNYAEPWNNKGTILINLKNYDEAITAYNQSLKINPNKNYLLGNILSTQMQICDWSNFIFLTQDIKKNLLNNKAVISPFVCLSIFDSPQLHKLTAELYVKDNLNFINKLELISKRPKRKKIKVGYFSMNFAKHPVSYLIAEIIELHNRNNFEIYAFSFGDNEKDDMRKRLELAFDNFIEVKELSDTDIIKLSRKLEIDIAVDLGGFTKGSRPQIFAERAAPIQVSYIGYLGTWSNKCMDYIIADKIVITKENQKYFSEKIIYLPNQFQANSSLRITKKINASKHTYCLPEKFFIYCCFNNNWKINPSTAKSWSKILKKNLNSILWLYAENFLAKKNLKKFFNDNGVNSERIIFTEKTSFSDYLNKYKFADLFLDTFPYNAGATASDALRMGLPILTLEGQSFAGRQASSLLKCIDLPELITSTTTEYEKLAIDLAYNPKKIIELKKKLTFNLLNKPIFNSKIFTNNIETAYQIIYDRYHQSIPNDHVYVDIKPF